MVHYLLCIKQHKDTVSIKLAAYEPYFSLRGWWRLKLELTELMLDLHSSGVHKHESK